MLNQYAAEVICRQRAKELIAEAEQVRLADLATERNATPLRDRLAKLLRGLAGSARRPSRASKRLAAAD